MQIPVYCSAEQDQPHINSDSRRCRLLTCSFTAALRGAKASSIFGSAIMYHGNNLIALAFFAVPQACLSPLPHEPLTERHRTLNGKCLTCGLNPIKTNREKDDKIFISDTDYKMLFLKSGK